jgi:hypothetical protein
MITQYKPKRVEVEGAGRGGGGESGGCVCAMYLREKGAQIKVHEKRGAQKEVCAYRVD